MRDNPLTRFPSFPNMKRLPRDQVPGTAALERMCVRHACMRRTLVLMLWNPFHCAMYSLGNMNSLYVPNRLVMPKEPGLEAKRRQRGRQGRTDDSAPVDGPPAGPGW
jgi:hypothetical protein